MTFDPSKPADNESPAIFPAQNRSNMAVVESNFSSDHQFNNTPLPNDNSGYHTLIKSIPQNPSGNLANTGRSYCKSVHGRIERFYMDDVGREYQITPTIPIRAAVNFYRSSPPEVAPIVTIRSQFNVSSVTRGAVGDYTIYFTEHMPDNNYIVMVTGMAFGNNVKCYGCVMSHDNYGIPVAVNKIDVRFTNSLGTPQDVIMGNVVIMSVS